MKYFFFSFGVRIRRRSNELLKYHKFRQQILPFFLYLCCCLISFKSDFTLSICSNISPPMYHYKFHGLSVGLSSYIILSTVSHSFIVHGRFWVFKVFLHRWLSDSLQHQRLLANIESVSDPSSSLLALI